FVLKAVARKVDAMYVALKQAFPNAKPVMGVETPEAGDREFNFKMLYERIREAASEPPLVGARPQPLPWEASGDRRGGSVVFVRNATSKCLPIRHCRLLMLDEGAHMLSVPNGERLRRNAMTLKSIANDGDTVLLLCCSYDGLPFLEVDSQLTR